MGRDARREKDLYEQTIDHRRKYPDVTAWGAFIMRHPRACSVFVRPTHFAFYLFVAVCNAWIESWQKARRDAEWLRAMRSEP